MGIFIAPVTKMHHVDFFHHWSIPPPTTEEQPPKAQTSLFQLLGFTAATAPKMNSELPTKDELMARTADELPITQDEASKIAAAESDMTGRGPIKGGPAAIAQSLHDKQQNFLAKASEVAHKSADEITKEDAAEVQRSEVGRLQAWHCCLLTFKVTLTIGGVDSSPGTSPREGLHLCEDSVDYGSQRRRQEFVRGCTLCMRSRRKVFLVACQRVVCTMQLDVT